MGFLEIILDGSGPTIFRSCWHSDDNTKSNKCFYCQALQNSKDYDDVSSNRVPRST